MSDDLATVRAWFEGFATGSPSPLYGRLSREIADDADVTGILLGAPPAQRLPWLLFAGVNLLRVRAGVPFPQSGPELAEFCADHRPELGEVLSTRNTQTNEVARCTALWPCFALAAEDAPLALIEVGASRGLNLNCDRYAYDYSDRRGGELGSAVELTCELRTGEPSLEVPPLEWRAGIDLQPMPSEEWLRACVFADQPERLARLNRALEIAHRHPPRIIEGDALDLLGDLIAEAPDHCQVIVFHTAVRPYLDDEQVRELRNLTRDITYVTAEPVGARAAFELEIDGERVGSAQVHGRWLEWTGGPNGPHGPSAEGRVQAPNHEERDGGGSENPEEQANRRQGTEY